MPDNDLGGYGDIADYNDYAYFPGYEDDMPFSLDNPEGFPEYEEDEFPDDDTDDDDEEG